MDLLRGRLEVPMDDRTNPTRSGNAGARYDNDLYTWAVEQAVLLRAGKIAEADALSIAEKLDDDGIRFPDRFADQNVRKRALGPFRVIEAAGGIYRTVSRDAVLLRDHIVFVSVPRSRVDCARAVLERDVIGNNPG